jgi:hypothetical protein
MRRSTASVVVAAVGVWSFAAGCGDDDDGGEAAGGGEVNVVVSEFTVEPDPESVGAGEVTFVVDNKGAETNEFLFLEAGTYLLLCNVVEEEESGEVESHFKEGMHATFTVE